MCQFNNNNNIEAFSIISFLFWTSFFLYFTVSDKKWYSYFFWTVLNSKSTFAKKKKSIPRYWNLWCKMVFSHRQCLDNHHWIKKNIKEKYFYENLENYSTAAAKKEGARNINQNTLSPSLISTSRMCTQASRIFLSPPPPPRTPLPPAARVMCILRCPTQRRVVPVTSVSSGHQQL